MTKPKLSPQTRKVFEDLGRLGGKTRAKRLTPEQRREIARKAAEARWSRRKS